MAVPLTPLLGPNRGGSRYPAAAVVSTVGVTAAVIATVTTVDRFVLVLLAAPHCRATRSASLQSPLLQQRGVRPGLRNPAPPPLVGNRRPQRGGPGAWRRAVNACAVIRRAGRIPAKCVNTTRLTLGAVSAARATFPPCRN